MSPTATTMKTEVPESVNGHAKNLMGSNPQFSSPQQSEASHQLRMAILQQKSMMAFKAAFAFHHRMIVQAKNKAFKKPSREILVKLVKEKESQELKSTTSTIETVEDLKDKTRLKEEFPIDLLPNMTVSQKKATNVVREILQSYEDFLAKNSVMTEVPRMTSIHRALLNGFANHYYSLSNVCRETVALTIILLSAEILKINRTVILAFADQLESKRRIEKISQIRSSKSYGILGALIGKKK